MWKRTAVAAALLAAPALAQAEPPNLYWGLSLGDYQVDRREAGMGTADSTDLGLRLGYHFTDFIGVEARAGFDAEGVGSEAGADTTYAAVFGRFDLPFEKTNIYLLLGASEVQFDGDTADDDEYDPVAGGLGIELYGSERTAVTLEYMVYSDDVYSGFGIGFKHHFDLPSFR